MVEQKVWALLDRGKIRSFSVKQRMGKHVPRINPCNSGDMDIRSQPYYDDSSGKMKRAKIQENDLPPGAL